MAQDTRRRLSGYSLAIGGGDEALEGSGPSLADSALIAQLLLFAVVAVTTPVVEEIAFRGYLFPALARARGPWVGAGSAPCCSVRRIWRSIRRSSSPRWP